ncbi:MAG: hypothetical protein Q4A12_07290 [Eubacteriales bacterium]|nr:hypothetical protein [Eubacteriales bacterium]
MKRIACLLFAFALLLCGCSQTEQINVGSFSYESDCAYYGDDPGVKESGFVNIEQSEVNDAEKAVELAKKECTVEYDTVSVAFDSKLKIYRVSFYKENQLGGNQDVYIDQNGITQMIIYGE